MRAPDLTRREFMKSSATAGVWLLSMHLPMRLLASETKPGALPWCVYVTINSDNSVVMASPVMDMGQFMRTTGPMIIADEMDLEWSSIRFTAEVPMYVTRNEKDELTYSHAHMDTGGSHAVERNWDYMRRAGATARHMLMEEAAERWNLSVQQLSTKSGYVIDSSSGRKYSYGELAHKAALRAIDPADVKLKDRSQYRIIGTDRRNVDALSIVTGKPLYAIDADYPGTLQAVICRAPALGADIATYDKTAAMQVPGVRHVIEMQRQIERHWLSGETQILSAGIAVLADDLWSAMKGRAALGATWKNMSPFANQDSQAQLSELTKLVNDDAAPVNVTMNDGDIDAALASADMVLEHTYEKPLLAHACLEPHNCVADVRESDATIVVGTQFPANVAKEVEKIAGIDALKVSVITKRMGGGFGRKSEMDYVREAIILSHRLKRPVKVTWMREDEIEHDFFDPAAVTRIRAGLKGGRIVAWHHRQGATKGAAQDSCVPARIIKNYRIELSKYESHLRAGAWRPPMHIMWSFATESMLDELAHAARRDPLEFRLELMSPHAEYPFTGWGAQSIHSGRMAKCYEAAAELAQWHRKRPAGTGIGIAGHFTHGTYAAFVVEVSVANKSEVHINRAWGAIDCGLAINPNHIRNQMEGGFIDGLNAALFNKAHVKAGRVQNNNFGSLRWMRMNEAPTDIQVTIIDNGYKPTGVGEPPTPPAPAALANAIFAACGQRIRRMPFNESISI